MTAEALHRALRRSTLLIAAGLLIEAGTLYWSHPLTFLAFIFLGGTLVGLGMLLYLYAIASQ